MRQTMHRITAAVAVAFASLALLVPSQAQAQGWPQRPVRFVIPFGPGAGADIGARLIQEKLSTRWGKPVVIENRPGGDSMIAIQAVLSANDDHTFLWGPAGNFTVHPYLYEKLPYNPDDIIPIARFSATILAVGVPASMNFVNLADFVKRAKAEPGKFNAAAVPGITEFAFDLFRQDGRALVREGALPRHRAGRQRSRRGTVACLRRRPMRSSGRIARAAASRPWW